MERSIYHKRNIKVELSTRDISLSSKERLKIFIEGVANNVGSNETLTRTHCSFSFDVERYGKTDEDYISLCEMVPFLYNLACKYQIYITLTCGIYSEKHRVISICFYHKSDRKYYETERGDASRFSYRKCMEKDGVFMEYQGVTKYFSIEAETDGDMFGDFHFWYRRKV